LEIALDSLLDQRGVLPLLAKRFSSTLAERPPMTRNLELPMPLAKTLSSRLLFAAIVEKWAIIGLSNAHSRPPVYPLSLMRLLNLQPGKDRRLLPLAPLEKGNIRSQARLELLVGPMPLELRVRVDVLNATRRRPSA
jgi:hypothetical protein